MAETLNLKECDAFRMTFNLVPIGIFHMSTDGKFIRVNQKFSDILGYSNCFLREYAINHSFEETMLAAIY